MRWDVSGEREDLAMSAALKISGAYMHKDRKAARTRTKHRGRRSSGAAGICPFTPEAILDCAVRKRKLRTACHVSLEGCLSNR